MGFPWKAVLLGIGHVAEPVAAEVVPGGQVIDGAVHAIIDAKTGADKEQAILLSISAGLATMEAIKPDMIADPILFNKGIVDAHNAFDEISKAIKKQ